MPVLRRTSDDSTDSDFIFDLQKLGISFFFFFVFYLRNTTHSFYLDHRRFHSFFFFFLPFRVSHVPIPGAMDLHFMSLLSSTLLFSFPVLLSLSTLLIGLSGFDLVWSSV